MKKTTLFLSAAALSFTLISCGGNSAESTEANTADSSTEMVEETKPEGKTGKMMADTSASMVHWKGTMVGVYSHEGNLKLTEGYIEMDKGEITGGKFVVDMTTMQPTDENYNAEEGKTPEQLVGHLSGDDFFAVAENPTAMFVVKSADREAKTLTGDLTIRGNTHEETVTDIRFEDNAAKGKLVFDRQQYDVSWKAMKDVVLEDDIELDITLVLTKG